MAARECSVNSRETRRPEIGGMAVKAFVKTGAAESSLAQFTSSFAVASSTLGIFSAVAGGGADIERVVDRKGDRGAL